MSTDLAIRPDQSGFNDQQIAALRALGVEDAPVGDLDLFFHQAARLGLDPFAKQIYLIGRNTKVIEWNNGKKVERWVVKYTIQTGIDGFRVIRDRPHAHAYQGQKEEWCGADGVWRDVWVSDEPPAAAKVSLFIEGYLQPIVGIARYVEYVQTTSSGDPNSMWKKMPAGQLAKCAEALALRKAYPNDLSGVYTDDEMGQADSVGGTTLIASRPGQQRVDERTGEVHDEPVPHPPHYDQAEADEWAAQITATPELGHPTLPKAIESDTLAGVFLRAQRAGVLTHLADDPERIPEPKTIEQLIADRRDELQAADRARKAGA